MWCLTEKPGCNFRSLIKKSGELEVSRPIG